ncbi:DUF6943 family protein [Parachryseolinea silvisoli]|uniref:DUF6943 family protein n=1 Tax=Parachryseolinea silvisoli TaxID=2873601 RepID=UPI002265CE25|nr:hypothetical protein [Parachryseolinea silvisoli]MCD9015164.1 hypothetical protein [Parachryseolinea silvisoli]
MKIKTHRMTREYSGEYFFILSKGNNAGKPLVKPCPNCFVLLASDAVEKEQCYWLCYGLWEGGFFRQFLTGSVISFIHVDDLRQVITAAAEKVAGEAESLNKIVNMLTLLTKHHDALHEQLNLIKRAKRSLMYKILK